MCKHSDHDHLKNKLFILDETGIRPFSVQQRRSWKPLPSFRSTRQPKLSFKPTEMVVFFLSANFGRLTSAAEEATLPVVGPQGHGEWINTVLNLNTTEGSGWAILNTVLTGPPCPPQKKETLFPTMTEGHSPYRTTTTSLKTLNPSVRSPLISLQPPCWKPPTLPTRYVKIPQR